MTNEERIETVRNVLSDLQALLDDNPTPEDWDNEVWQDAKCAAEYITEEEPH